MTSGYFGKCPDEYDFQWAARTANGGAKFCAGSATAEYDWTILYRNTAVNGGETLKLTVPKGFVLLQSDGSTSSYSTGGGDGQILYGGGSLTYGAIPSSLSDPDTSEWVVETTQDEATSEAWILESRPGSLGVLFDDPCALLTDSTASQALGTTVAGRSATTDVDLKSGVSPAPGTAFCSYVEVGGSDPTGSPRVMVEVAVYPPLANTEMDDLVVQMGVPYQYDEDSSEISFSPAIGEYALWGGSSAPAFYLRSGQADVVVSVENRESMTASDFKDLSKALSTEPAKILDGEAATR